MMAKELKRSLTIAGHRTSLSLEPEFWDALQSEARKRGKSIASLVSEIDQARGERNLSSAIRVWLLLSSHRGSGVDITAMARNRVAVK